MSAGISGQPIDAQTTDFEHAALREKILQSPDAVLDDPEIMTALLRSQEAGDRKVMDLRAAQLVRLESSLSKLREAHRDVIDAALESMNGVEQAHQAALMLMEADETESLAVKVRTHLPNLLPIQEARLCLSLDDPVYSAARRRPHHGPLEGAGDFSSAWQWAQRLLGRIGAVFDPTPDQQIPPRSEEDQDPLDPALVLLPAEAIQSRCPKPLRRSGAERRQALTGPGRPVAISVRKAEEADRMLFSAATQRLESVASISLDLSPYRSQGALVFGAADDDTLRSAQLIEQLAFIGGVVERLIRADDAIDCRPARPNASLRLALDDVRKTQR